MSLAVGLTSPSGEPRDELLAELPASPSCRRDTELEHRRRPGFREAPGDRLADLRQLPRPRPRPAAATPRGRGAVPAGAGRGLLDVLFEDSAVRARPLDRCQVEPALARDPPGEPARLDPRCLTRRGRGRRLGRRGRTGVLLRGLALGGFFLRRLLGRGSLGRSTRQAPPTRPVPPSLPTGPLPFSSITATVVPTSTSPSATTILVRSPSCSASTSCVTLSVSSS